MARRKSSFRSKIQPAVLTMTFASSTSGASTEFIDLSQVASVMNRRFYRQGINWAVAGFKFSSLKGGSVNVSKLPNTWVMSNAWEKSFRAWQKMNREALEEQESIRPKFLDFKIYADSDHHSSGYGSNMMPVSIGAGAIASVATPGEWEASKVTHPLATGATEGATVQSELIAVGASYPGAGASGFNAVSLIEGYAASRGLPNVLDPNTPFDAADVENVTPENWLGAMFNEGTGVDRDVISDMITENNIASYPFENDGIHVDTMYPGGANQLTGLEWHDFAQIYNTSATTNVGITTMKGGNFPCGLIRIDWTPDEAANLIVQVDLIPGNHRGYLCEPMTEM